MRFFSMDRITFYMALIGFLLSIFNALRDYRENRVSISVSMPCTVNDSGYLFMKIIMINNSKQPISITRVQANINNASYELGLCSLPMITYNDPVRAGKAVEKTTCLPIQLNSLGYGIALFQIENLNIETGTPIDLLIGTNRGKIKKHVVKPAITGDDLLSFLRCL